MTATERLKLIIQDLEADAKSLEGLPLTGAVMGERFGQTYAMIGGVAQSLIEMVDNVTAQIDKAIANSAQGMSTRDIFACHALRALIGGNLSPESACEQAYIYADTMMKTRK